MSLQNDPSGVFNTVSRAFVAEVVELRPLVWVVLANRVKPAE
jgi:hypothetical protein